MVWYPISVLFPDEACFTFSAYLIKIKKKQIRQRLITSWARSCPLRLNKSNARMMTGKMNFLDHQLDFIAKGTHRPDMAQDVTMIGTDTRL